MPSPARWIGLGLLALSTNLPAQADKNVREIVEEAVGLACESASVSLTHKHPHFIRSSSAFRFSRAVVAAHSLAS